MKVHFEQSRGFAGMHIPKTVDTNSLLPEKSLQLENMVQNSKFFDLPLKSPSLPPQDATDYYRYKITVETNERKHTVDATNIAMQSEFSNLVDFLIEQAAAEKK